MSSVITFQPIHQPGLFSTPKNSRPTTPLSLATDSSNENEASTSPAKTRHGRHESAANAQHRAPKYSRARDDSNSPVSNAGKAAESQRFLLRRSSSAMRVRELRDVLTKMTEESSCGENGGNEDKEVAVTGSQKARLLVASQQCLVSRLQDLRNEMESMDNEVTRVRNDIVSSRRYFSAMTGIPCGPEWTTVRHTQSDSAYTSPTSFISRSNDISPYSSDNDYPIHPHQPPTSYTTTTSSLSSSTSSSSSTFTSHHASNSKASNEAFRQLQQFKEQQQQQQQQQQMARYRNSANNNGELSRSDSCSSFMSWRSETEMASLFPEDCNRCVSVSPQITPRTVRRWNSP